MNNGSQKGRRHRSQKGQDSQSSSLEAAITIGIRAVRSTNRGWRAGRTVG